MTKNTKNRHVLNRPAIAILDNKICKIKRHCYNNHLIDEHVIHSY